MDRLTKRGPGGLAYCPCTEVSHPMDCYGCIKCDKSLEKLAQYEDAEEEGRLIILPCKVGDTVYVIEPNLCDLRDKDTCNVYCEGWDFSCPDFRSDSTIRQRHFQLDDLRHFGETVFRSREEAEAALGGDAT